MAEYSKEYAEIIGDEFYDFSYKELFEGLQNGQYEPAICEGLGTFGVHKKNNIYYLVVSNDGDIAEYSTYLKAFRKISTK